MLVVTGARAESRHDSRRRGAHHLSSGYCVQDCEGGACSVSQRRAPNGLRSAAICSLALLAGSLGLGCSEGDTDPLAAAGTATAGTGGSAGQTGSSGTGGTGATAGTSGGGTSGGGTSGGGNGGSGPAADPLQLYDFAQSTDAEGWSFVYAVPERFIAPAPAGDAGPAEPPPAGVASARYDSMGDPTGNAGSLRLGLPFDAPSQKITLELNVATDNVGINLAGRSISARVLVVSGYSSDPQFPPGLKLYVKTGATSLYADSGYINIVPGPDWQTFTWANVSNPAYTDPAGMHAPTDVRQIGIEFDTGDMGTYSPAEVLLDTVTIY